MELRNIIFHELRTEKYSSQVDVVPRDSELPLPEPNAAKLVDEALQSYGADSSLAYAKFSHGWLPDRLRQFIDNGITFEQFSIHALNDLRTKLALKPFSTGGNLFIIYFDIEGVRYLMILLLKDIEGLIINGDLIEESHILNLDKLHFAALIEIENWFDDDGAYISFLKGAKRAEVTSYFKSFLCIDEDSFSDPNKNTKSLVQAIKDYCKSNVENEAERFSIRNRIDEEIRRRIDNNEDITIEAVGALINPDDNQGFIDFVNDSKYVIQPNFVASKAYLRGLTRFSGRNEEISISFEQSAIESGKIEFVQGLEGVEEPSLIIREIPASLLREINKLF